MSTRVQNDSTSRRATSASGDATPSAKEGASADAGRGCTHQSSGFLAGLRDEMVRRGEEGRAQSAAAMEELVRLRAEPRATGFIPRAKQILREMRAFAAI